MSINNLKANLLINKKNIKQILENWYLSIQERKQSLKTNINKTQKDTHPQTKKITIKL